MKVTQVIFVDKDFAEISAISELFPAIEVLLCQFHVFMHVRKVIAGLLLETNEKAELLGLFKALMHSSTQVMVGILIKKCTG